MRTTKIMMRTTRLSILVVIRSNFATLPTQMKCTCNANDLTYISCITFESKCGKIYGSYQMFMQTYLEKIEYFIGVNNI